MDKEYRAKVFKSGNSLALRLPKALGLKEGAEMVVREEQSKYTFEPADTSGRKPDISGFDGKAPWLKRLEEHTSELQSLMRISYAVFRFITTINENMQTHTC